MGRKGGWREMDGNTQAPYKDHAHNLKKHFTVKLVPTKCPGKQKVCHRLLELYNNRFMKKHSNCTLLFTIP